MYEPLKCEPIKSRPRSRRKSWTSRVMDLMTALIIGLMFVSTGACTVLGVMQVVQMIRLF